MGVAAISAHVSPDSTVSCYWWLLQTECPCFIQ